MSRSLPGRAEESEFFDLDAELEARCRCGHRSPEHSLHGPCHGCHDCDDDGHDSDHAYERCRCTEFQLAEEVAAEEFVLSRTA